MRGGRIVVTSAATLAALSALAHVFPGACIIANGEATFFPSARVTLHRETAVVTLFALRRTDLFATGNAIVGVFAERSRASEFTGALAVFDVTGRRSTIRREIDRAAV